MSSSAGHAHEPPPSPTHPDTGPAGLSEREAGVVRLIALGYSNKEIAAHSRLSVKTVETYKARAMDKLGVKSRVGLVRYAADQGWLAGSPPGGTGTPPAVRPAAAAWDGGPLG